MHNKLLIAAVLFFLAVRAGAQTRLIHYWHFNNFATTSTAYTTPNIPVFRANYSILDTNKAVISYTKLPGTSAAYSSSLDAYTPTNLALDTPLINWNSRMGVPAGNSIRVRNPSDSMQLTFNIPTTRYHNILVKFATESSSASSGMKYQLYDYSVDSGATWSTTALSKTVDTTIATTYDTVKVRFNEAADSMVKNNPKLVFRIRFSGQTTGTSGNNRFDNITVDGDSIIGTVVPPSAVAGTAAFPETALYPNPAGAGLTLDVALAGSKSLRIFSIGGQQVAAYTVSASRTQLDLRQLQPGMYTISIRLEDGRSKTLSFVKQ